MKHVAFVSIVPNHSRKFGSLIKAFQTDEDAAQKAWFDYYPDADTDLVEVRVASGKINSLSDHGLPDDWKDPTGNTKGFFEGNKRVAPRFVDFIPYELAYKIGQPGGLTVRPKGWTEDLVLVPNLQQIYAWVGKNTGGDGSYNNLLDYVMR